MNILINYANELYRQAQKANTWSGYHIAKFDKVIEYSDKDIDEKFREDNKEILSEKRGNGLWLWKPYFVYKTLIEINDDDLLFYCDSGAVFIKGIQPIIEIMKKNDIWITETPLLEKQFTKKEVFDFFEADIENIKDTNQFQGSFICLRRTNETVGLVKDWLHYCCNKYLLSADYEKSKQEECFIAGREDQSILSVLAKKNGITAFQDPSQFGKIPELYWYTDRRYIKSDLLRHDYRPFIYLHRCKKIDFRCFCLFFLYCVLPKQVGVNYLKMKYKVVGK